MPQASLLSIDGLNLLVSVMQHNSGHHRCGSYSAAQLVASE